MPLTNISEWDDIHGLVHVTAINAGKKHPGGLSSSYNRYICETCGQSVSLYKHKAGTYAFRHPTNSKACDDKMSACETYPCTNPLRFSLPIRVNVESASIEVSIGFLPLPHTLMDRAEQDHTMLRISADDGTVIGNYAITSERFSFEHITYISTNNTISQQYYLNVSKGMSFYWPLIVEGINTGGTLFDKISGKRLPENASVIVGTEYWLISQARMIDHPIDIHVSFHRSFGVWKLYRVKAIRFSFTATYFLIKYRVRLTEKLSEVIYLWPPVSRSSHMLSNCADWIWMYKTDGYIDMYPSQQQYRYDSGFFRIAMSHPVQTLSLRTSENQNNVLKYTLMRHIPENAENKANVRHTYVTDIKDVQIESGLYATLPIKQRIDIQSEFDGCVRIFNDELEVDRIALKGDCKTRVDVRFNRVYCVFEGLDCVAEIRFQRSPMKAQGADDETLVRTLGKCSGDRVAASHLLGALARRMKDMPKTKGWLLAQIRAGSIKADAIKILTKSVGETKNVR